MYLLEITYKGNNLGDQISINAIADYIPTLIHDITFIKGVTTTKWVILRISRFLIIEIQNKLPSCTISITELVEGKKSNNVDDFL